MLLPLEEGEQFGFFVRGWSASQGAPEGIGDAFAIAFAPCFEGLAGECLGALDKDSFVQGDEGLERSVGTEAANAGKIPVRRVENLEHRIRGRARAEGVKSATIAVLSGFLLPGKRGVACRRLEKKFRGGRKNRGAADLRIQQTTGRKGDIAHNLGIYAQSRSARDQTIVWISSIQFGSHFR